MRNRRSSARIAPVSTASDTSFCWRGVLFALERILVRPSLYIQGCALYTGRHALVRIPHEFNARADLGWHVLEEQGVEIAALHICHNEAARFRSGLDATLAANLLGPL